MDDRSPDFPLAQIASRPMLAIAGLIAFLLIGGLLDVSQQIVALTSWQPIIKGPGMTQMAFWAFLAFSLGWIVYSLWGLRAVARNEALQKQLAGQQLWQHPLLVQVVFFVEHGVMATLYSLLTGDVNRGVILGILVLVHILAAVLLAPVMAKDASSV